MYARVWAIRVRCLFRCFRVFSVFWSQYSFGNIFCNVGGLQPDFGGLGLERGDVLVFGEGDPELAASEIPGGDYFRVHISDPGPERRIFDIYGYVAGVPDIISRIDLLRTDDFPVLNPWWIGGEVYSQDEGFIWLPTSGYRRLRADGAFEWLLDTIEREDRYLLLQDAGEAVFSCEVRGEVRVLRGRKIISAKGDRLIVLDDVENPLIVSMESTYFSWRLIRVE